MVHVYDVRVSHVTESELLSVVGKIFLVVLLAMCLPLSCILISRRPRRGEYTSFRLKMLTETV